MKNKKEAPGKGGRAGCAKALGEASIGVVTTE